MIKTSLKSLTTILREEMGIQMDVHRMTKLLVPHVINNYLNGDKTYLYLFKSGLIRSIILNYNRNDKSSKGRFLVDKTERIDDGFQVQIELSLIEKDINNGDVIGSILSHELNHVFVYLQKVNTPAKTLKHNESISMLRVVFNHNEPLKEFIDLMYLNIPEEIQSRVQETGYILDTIDGGDYRTIIKKLYLHQPLNDVKKMTHYDGSRLKDLDHDVMFDFIHEFNENLLSLGLKPKNFKTVDQFIDYYVKFINRSGNKLNRKIMKLVGEKLNENNYLNVGSDLLYEIFNI